MILCNLSSPKFEDGIAKGDMSKLCTKTMTDMVDAAETALEQAMQMTDVMQNSDKITDAELGPHARVLHLRRCLQRRLVHLATPSEPTSLMRRVHSRSLWSTT